MSQKRTRSFSARSAIIVTFYDPGEGQSRSFTVYGSDLASLPKFAQERIGQRWRCTRLDSRRHKRRV